MQPRALHWTKFLLLFVPRAFAEEKEKEKEKEKRESGVSAVMCPSPLARAPW
jgi:hypothetical protein